MRTMTLAALAALLPAVAMADDVPGDTTTTATLPARTYVQGAFDFEGDSDWYAVQLHAERNYAIGSTYPANSFTGLAVRDRDGAVVVSNGDNNPGDITSSGGFEFTVPSDGTYYVDVHAASAPAYPTPYTLLLDDADCPESRRSPCQIGAGQTLPGTLASWEEGDFLWFQAAAGKTYQLRVDACEPIDLRVYGYYGAPKATGTPDASGASLTWRAPQGKWFLVRVIGTDPSEAGTPYDLTLSPGATVKRRAADPDVPCAGRPAGKARGALRAR